MRKEIFFLLILFFVRVDLCFANDFGEWYEEDAGVLENEGIDEENFSEEDSLEDIGEFIGTLYMQGEFLDGDILKVSVFTEDFQSPILGIAFHLLYDGEMLAFLRYEPGEFLETGGDPFYMVKDDMEGQKLFFGETLRRDDSFPFGGGKVVDFYYQILEEEGFYFEFENGVISTIETVRQDLDKVEWQDLSISRTDDYDLVFSAETTDISRTDSFTLSNFERYFNYILFTFLSGLLAVAVFIFNKKYRKKIRGAYVNFK